MTTRIVILTVTTAYQTLLLLLTTYYRALTPAQEFDASGDLIASIQIRSAAIVTLKDKVTAAEKALAADTNYEFSGKNLPKDFEIKRASEGAVEFILTEYEPTLP